MRIEDILKDKALCEALVKEFERRSQIEPDPIFRSIQEEYPHVLFKKGTYKGKIYIEVDLYPYLEYLLEDYDFDNSRDYPYLDLIIDKFKMDMELEVTFTEIRDKDHFNLETFKANVKENIYYFLYNLHYWDQEEEFLKLEKGSRFLEEAIKYNVAPLMEYEEEE